MRVRAVDFILFEVSDMERSLSFYRDLLGLQVGETFGDFWIELDAPPTTLALYCPRTTENREPKPGGASIAFAVEDVKAAVEEMRGKGVTIIHEPFESPGCTGALIKDPDGNVLCLHHRKDGTFG